MTVINTNVNALLSQAALKKNEREMTIAKVNTDINPLSAGKFGIRGIPALLLFHNGQLVDQQAGAMPKPLFDQWLDRHMA